MRIKYTLAIGCILVLMSFTVHKFYVSNNIIEFNARTGVYEVTMKIFTDDLEKAVSPDGKSLFLGSEKEASDANVRIQEYMRRHFRISINDRPVELQYVGKEVDPELTHLYFDFLFAESLTSITMENSVLFEHFPEQKNIMDVRVNGWNRTVFLTLQQPKETLIR